MFDKDHFYCVTFWLRMPAVIVNVFALSVLIFACTYFREFWSILQNQIHAKLSFKQHLRKEIRAK